MSIQGQARSTATVMTCWTLRAPVSSCPTRNFSDVQALGDAALLLRGREPYPIKADPDINEHLSY